MLVPTDPEHPHAVAMLVARDTQVIEQRIHDGEMRLTAAVSTAAVIERLTAREAGDWNADDRLHEIAVIVRAAVRPSTTDPGEHLG